MTKTIININSELDCYP